ncbi:MAG TPA: LLM class flavin-dependent oxidoreductase [Acidimicrobiales bacterium]|nr:LLM class flavin-dependent oxidoreductase [Acidimicrobiales bacterium]
MTTTVRLGLVLPSREAVLWAGGDVAWVVERARAAEVAGFDSVWVGESPLARPRPDALVTLAAVAARTARVQLGTAVVLPLLRQAIGLAHAVATLDRLAGGRVILGVGPGAEVPSTDTELASFGASTTGRVGRLLEAVSACRRAWRADEPEACLQPAPAQPGGPPVWLAANGPRLLVQAGRHFDGWLPYSPSPAAYATGLEAVASAAAPRGRSVTPAVFLTAAVDDDPERAADTLDNYMMAYYGLPAEAMASVQAARAGTAEQIAGWATAYVDAGARHVLLRPACTDPAHYDETAAGLLGAVRGALPRAA